MDRIGGYDQYLREAARQVAEAEAYEADWQPCAVCSQVVGPQDDIEVLEDGGLVHLSCYVAVQYDECWIWPGYINPSGYGQAGARRNGTRLVHRIAYELWVGPVPRGWFIDHLCWNRACFNPGHLRVLSPPESSRRQRRAVKRFCVNGHEYTPENTYQPKDGGRYCRACGAAYQRRRRQMSKEVA